MKQFLVRLNKKQENQRFLELLERCEAPKGQFNECAAISHLLTPRSICLYSPREMIERSIHNVHYGDNFVVHETIRKMIRGENNWFTRAVRKEHGPQFIEFLRRKVRL